MFNNNEAKCYEQSHSFQSYLSAKHQILRSFHNLDLTTKDLLFGV